MNLGNGLGKVIGGALFIGAAAAVWMWPKAKAPDAAPEPVRPVRSVEVRKVAEIPDFRFSGQVKADRSRTLSFKMPGRIERIPVDSGMRIKRGDRLAWLVQDDFRNAYDQAVAAAERDRLTYERLAAALEKNAVSCEEVSKAEAQLKQSEAALRQAKYELDESVLLAPFDGIVASVPATELEMQMGRTPVVVVQDMDAIKIDVSVPESAVIIQKKLAHDGKAAVTFDSFPGQSYPVQFKEYTAAADMKTQTFTATYSMKPPDDLLVLPGMSATVTISGISYQGVTGGAMTDVEVPESAIGAESSGELFVWVLNPADKEGEFLAHKRTVTVRFRTHGRVFVSSGLAAGERVATAGVAMLTEDRRVSLLKARDTDGSRGK